MSKTPAVAYGKRLAFTALGLPPLEPSFASVESSTPSDECHGVLYEISELDWLKVCATEGVPFGYMEEHLMVTPYAAHLNESEPWESQSEPSEVSARTLRWRQPQTFLGLPPVEPFPPSLRYMGLLRAGAAEAGLAMSWRTVLAELPPL